MAGNVGVPKIGLYSATVVRFDQVVVQSIHSTNQCGLIVDTEIRGPRYRTCQNVYIGRPSLVDDRDVPVELVRGYMCF